MKLTFLGANHEVTGSCTLVEAAGHRFLVDCGMEQGADVYENQPLPIAPGELDGILLTHAHIDHTGRVPYMYKQGFSGPIYCTNATVQLCDIMLRDSAHIQEMEAEWKNRKNQRKGEPPVVPDYTIEDAQKVMAQFKGIGYNTVTELWPGIRARFVDVGHLLGSSSIELWVTENGQEQKIVFSGDIGNYDQPLIRDPSYVTEADFVVMESTYGDRLHGDKPNYVSELAQILQQTFDRGGNVVIPAFAVGRTQEMLYFLRQIKNEGLIHGHAHWPVYVDSPLAIEATSIFHKNVAECFDDEALDLVLSGQNPIAFPDLKVAVSSEESRAINFDQTPKVILSAGGMCDAGRVRHHLKHNLWRSESTVLFVGFQAAGTLGRVLLEGADSVKLFGEEIEVEAELRQLTGMSGHADKNGLLTWLSQVDPRPVQVFVVHGEDNVENAFAADLAERGYTAAAPYNGAEWELTGKTATCKYIGNTQRKEPARPGEGGRAPSAAYQRLLEAGKRLMALIPQWKGGANKDLGHFADQILAICQKWAR